jgi:hypothetical protein
MQRQGRRQEVIKCALTGLESMDDRKLNPNRAGGADVRRQAETRAPKAVKVCRRVVGHTSPQSDTAP